MKSDQSSCPPPCRSGFYFTEEDGTFLALGDTIIAQIKYEKNISNFTGTSKPNFTDDVCLQRTVKIALYLEFRNLDWIPGPPTYKLNDAGEVIKLLSYMKLGYNHT